jgi:hypothetical protein
MQPWGWLAEKPAIEHDIFLDVTRASPVSHNVPTTAAVQRLHIVRVHEPLVGTMGISVLYERIFFIG